MSGLITATAVVLPCGLGHVVSIRPLPPFDDDGTPQQVIGSDPLERQIRELGSDVHIFGHTHIPIDMTSDGVRYVQWPLGELSSCLQLLLLLPLHASASFGNLSFAWGVEQPNTSKHSLWGSLWTSVHNNSGVSCLPIRAPSICFWRRHRHDVYPRSTSLSTVTRLQKSRPNVAVVLSLSPPPPGLAATTQCPHRWAFHFVALFSSFV